MQQMQHRVETGTDGDQGQLLLGLELVRHMLTRQSWVQSQAAGPTQALLQLTAAQT